MYGPHLYSGVNPSEDFAPAIEWSPPPNSRPLFLSLHCPAKAILPRTSPRTVPSNGSTFYAPFLTFTLSLFYQWVCIGSCMSNVIARLTSCYRSHSTTPTPEPILSPPVWSALNCSYTSLRRPICSSGSRFYEDAGPFFAMALLRGCTMVSVCPLSRTLLVWCFIRLWGER